MHLYILHGYSEEVVLVHEKEFSQSEFVKMCKEAPYGGVSNAYYDWEKIIKYLKKTYKFKKAKFTAGFFVDKAVEEK